MKCPACERAPIRFVWVNPDRRGPGADDASAVCSAVRKCGFRMHLPDGLNRKRSFLETIVKRYAHDSERFVYYGASLPAT